MRGTPVPDVKLPDPAGERPIGAKLSLGEGGRYAAGDPQFEWLTEPMLASSGVVDVRQLVRPHVEPRLGFVLARPLTAPLLSGSELLAATDSVVPCLEVVDGAPGADDGGVARLHVGDAVPPPADGHLRRLRVHLYTDGALWAPVSARARALVPVLEAATWLANRMLWSAHRPQAGTLLICPVSIGRLELLPEYRVIGRFGGIGSVELRVRGLGPSGSSPPPAAA
jgi:2-keto-4-pentenoate hydratase